MMDIPEIPDITNNASKQPATSKFKPKVEVMKSNAPDLKTSVDFDEIQSIWSIFKFTSEMHLPAHVVEKNELLISVPKPPADSRKSKVLIIWRRWWWKRGSEWWYSTRFAWVRRWASWNETSRSEAVDLPNEWGQGFAQRIERHSSGFAFKSTCWRPGIEEGSSAGMGRQWYWRVAELEPKEAERRQIRSHATR